MSTRVGNGGIFSEERPSGCVWKSAGERRDIAELKKKRNIKTKPLDDGLSFCLYVCQSLISLFFCNWVMSKTLTPSPWTTPMDYTKMN